MTSLGGGKQGIMPKQTMTTQRDSEQAQMRRILRQAWNTEAATGIIHGYSRKIGPYRAVNNAGDFLSRQNYACGGPFPIQPNHVSWRSRMGHIQQSCDTTGISAANCNPKYVPDASDYIKFKKQQVSNRLYNDSSTGGNDHPSSITYVLPIRKR
jgi:hypothetical protein